MSGALAVGYDGTASQSSARSYTAAAITSRRPRRILPNLMKVGPSAVSSTRRPRARSACWRFLVGRVAGDFAAWSAAARDPRRAERGMAARERDARVLHHPVQRRRIQRWSVDSSCQYRLRTANVERGAGAAGDRGGGREAEAPRNSGRRLALARTAARCSAGRVATESTSATAAQQESRWCEARPLGDRVAGTAAGWKWSRATMSG